jgi:hypothetical protein
MAELVLNAFVSGSSTAFGFYDADPVFRADAERVLRYVARRIGDSQLDVELSSSDVYTCFEEATMEFGAIMNAYQAKSALATFLGTPTGSLTGAENRYPQFSLEWARRQAEAYNDIVGLNSKRPMYSGSIDLVPGQQHYDLQSLTTTTGSDGFPQRMVIRDVYHVSPISAMRFFGTTSFMNYLNSEFSFESYTPETIFYLLPIWEDILRGMQFETSNRVRRSNYSYGLHNNVLTLYPTPVNANRLWFRYQLADGSVLGGASGSAGWDRSVDGVANMSNIPFGNIAYSLLNSISRQWIFQMTLALCKETLGLVRRKMGAIPVGDGELNLDGSDLVNDARAEMERLRAYLTGLLEDMTYDKLTQRASDQAAALEEVLKRSPLKIYVG